MLSQNVTQYMHLHARDANFEQTVQHARWFVASVDGPKNRKGIVKISTPPSRDATINRIVTGHDKPILALQNEVSRFGCVCRVS